MLEGYPFIFQMNDRSYSDELLEYTMQYRFKSSKSNHTAHFRNDPLSLYILVNRRYVGDMESHVKRINDYVADAMVNQ